LGFHHPKQEKKKEKKKGKKSVVPVNVKGIVDLQLWFESLAVVPINSLIPINSPHEND